MKLQELRNIAEAAIGCTEPKERFDANVRFADVFDPPLVLRMLKALQMSDLLQSAGRRDFAMERIRKALIALEDA